MKKENILTLLEKTLKNGGLTIDENGNELSKTNGYMVSLLDTETTIYIKDKSMLELYQLFIKLIESKKQTIEQIKKVNQSLYIGLWIDNDILYFDISICIQRKSDAITTGKNNLQLAIYDLATQESISLFDEVYTIYKVLNNDLQAIAQVDKKEDIKRYLNTYNYNDLIITDIDNIPDNKNIVIIKDMIDYR